jgi:hypothetical protein
LRFKDLGRQATKTLWGDWKYFIREIMDEFNLDVYQGRGIIRENSYTEQSYLLLETKSECLYVFPVPGRALVFSVYHQKIPKEQLKIKSSLKKLDEENFIGSFGLGIRGADVNQSAVKKVVRAYVKKHLRDIYRHFWLQWLS